MDMKLEQESSVDLRSCSLPGTRRVFLGSILSAAACAVAAPVFAKTAGYIKNAGDVRCLNMVCGHTGESLKVIYWIEGEYIDEVMSEVNYFMRDWRMNKMTRMDKDNLDILAATHKLLDTSEPYKLISGFRTRETNRMLRSRSRSVAKNSLHIFGKAADVSVRGRSTRLVAKAAKHIKSGGVGRYSRSGFVHIDSGGLRQWSA